MNMLTFGEGFRNLDIRLYYMDNAVDGFTVAGDPPVSAYGATGYRMKDFQKIEEGKLLTFRTYAFAIDPNFKKGEGEACIELVHHPLQISRGDSWQAKVPKD